MTELKWNAQDRQAHQRCVVVANDSLFGKFSASLEDPFMDQEEIANSFRANLNDYISKGGPNKPEQGSRVVAPGSRMAEVSPQAQSMSKTGKEANIKHKVHFEVLTDNPPVKFNRTWPVNETVSEASRSFLTMNPTDKVDPTTPVVDSRAAIKGADGRVNVDLNAPAGPTSPVMSAQDADAPIIATPVHHEDDDRISPTNPRGSDTGPIGHDHDLSSAGPRGPEVETHSPVTRGSNSAHPPVSNTNERIDSKTGHIVSTKESTLTTGGTNPPSRSAGEKTSDSKRAEVQQRAGHK